MRLIGAWLPLLAATLLVLVLADNAYANLEEELPQGRLGYRWVPDPPKQPRSDAEEMALQVAKYGGGGLVGLWLLRKLFSDE